MPRNDRSDEVDVRDILKAIRQELSTQTDQSSEPGDLEAADLQVMQTHHNVREYAIDTDRRFAPLVIAAKRLVELVVKPYAGHFLDRQAHFNASLNRIVMGMMTKLDDLGGQLVAIREEQLALRETIETEMADIRSKLDSLKDEATGQYEVLREHFVTELEQQTRRLEQRGELRRQAVEQTKVELYRQLEQARDEVQSVSRQMEGCIAQAVQNLQVRFSEVEKRTVESQKEVEVRIAKELSAIVDFLEEILPAS
jgi:hypothetical protein